MNDTYYRAMNKICASEELKNKLKENIASDMMYDKPYISDTPSTKRSKRNIYVAVLSVAACVVVVTTIVFSTPYLKKIFDNNLVPEQPISQPSTSNATSSPPSKGKNKDTSENLLPGRLPKNLEKARDVALSYYSESVYTCMPIFEQKAYIDYVDKTKIKDEIFAFGIRLSTEVTEIEDYPKHLIVLTCETGKDWEVIFEDKVDMKNIVSYDANSEKNVDEKPITEKSTSQPYSDNTSANQSSPDVKTENSFDNLAPGRLPKNLEKAGIVAASYYSESVFTSVPIHKQSAYIDYVDKAKIKDEIFAFGIRLSTEVTETGGYPKHLIVLTCKTGGDWEVIFEGKVDMEKIFKELNN